MTQQFEHQIHEQNEMGQLFVDIGEEAFAIPIHFVKEVIELSKITSVPMCSNIINGVINVRGSVVPVIDAATRLGIPQYRDYDKYSCIVLYQNVDSVTDEVVTLGLIVNRVRSIEAVTESMATNTPAFGSHVPQQYILQMIRIHNLTLPILDMPALLDCAAINKEIVQSQRSSYGHRE
ncbi:chemotaxis protein CheW [Vibrio sp. YMD68]|uniref:chemotaxis protein CheW n=1 Tax=Vibrio sp. YMD68 TaxID=3042300 RepID=UPI00249B05EA|nr:chemotaxis protein CheW [Vibrio sp. YMD68]WGW01582.1 chemotaxis protein CheW [Vibrio sp. YMD68]